MRQVVIAPGEDGCWVAECPSLPGCISQGLTREEAIASIKEAIEGYVAALKDDGLPVAEEHSVYVHRAALISRKPAPRDMAAEREHWIVRMPCSV